MFNRFGSDNFDKVFKNSLKHSSLTAEEAQGNNIIRISNGRSELQYDISEIRQNYSKDKQARTIDDFISRAVYELSLEDRMLSFTNAQSFLRLMVLRDSETKPHMIFTDFAGSLKKTVCYCGDRDDIFMLDRKYLKKWGVPAEVLFSVADRNMGRILSRAEYTCSVIGNGVNVMEFETKGDPLIVSSMMCEDFRELAAEKLGPRFFVAAPSRESLIAVQEVADNILAGLGEAVVNDYKWADDPLTTDIFHYTPTDITVAGHFNPESY